MRYVSVTLAAGILAVAMGAMAPAHSSEDTPKPTQAPEVSCCAIFELRQYTLRAHQRDVLIELFDREFVETQEAVGMRIVGQFRDADNPDRFVWIRAFPDMEVRRSALTSFYGGRVWKGHSKQAVATMIDASDVLLLRPVDPPRGFDSLPAARPPIGAAALPASIVTATIYRLQAGAARDFPTYFRETVRPALRDVGVVPLAAFETEHALNTYPQLPVREGENVFVWFASFESAAAHSAYLERLSQSRLWDQVDSVLPSYLESPPQQVRLQPTTRSLLR